MHIADPNYKKKLNINQWMNDEISNTSDLLYKNDNNHDQEEEKQYREIVH
jgi:hypothetical protein